MVSLGCRRKTKELIKMTETISWEIEFDGIYAHVIKRPSGLHTFLYEIRYRKKGYNIAVSSTDINEAKRKFIQRAKLEGLIKDFVGDTAPNLKIDDWATSGKKNEKLLHLLNLNGLTAYKVAELLGYKDCSRVYKWLYCKATPNASTMLKLMGILSCSAEDILHCFAYKN